MRVERLCIYCIFQGSSRKYSLSSKTGTLLPEFPNPNNLILPDGVEHDKVRIFKIIMNMKACIEV